MTQPSEARRRAARTLAERQCQQRGFCVFTLGAERCSHCRSDRQGNPATPPTSGPEVQR